ncbi:L-serine ammonia-lyase, iron-sulfur-dependent subunit beta [Aneurinibacillus sp. Ricciae_BoGa-3]|uniref:L-serine ammonia-lyase, iron-sulfur-dependent subunit beta n=1 Tax=Aneurinibacillus sp. Ricciae_BoGa-3 TaxID=3022697 RepID=UPI002340A9B3|nr:L-serine ammonia-lyase, iron-sulfur-dependent subunit beta [Aneurinibacillus sp. Ricciae_BoGa-3]WCK53028.1 L-serine ammonia-lyase, iron-sulfur-dependent subunit beta [Aneurinibacillus sp. Ricciae_BoGa-3]
MKYRSVFDIIGPVMIGPSSSHTAGAARIGRVARTIFGKQPDAIDITFYGSFAQTYRGHGTDIAIVGGILDFDTFDKRIVDSISLAKELGIAVLFHVSDEEVGHPNTARIKLTDKDGENLEIAGISIGGGKIEIIEINGFPLKLSGNAPTLLVLHEDRYGLIAGVSNILTKYAINIGAMEVARRDKGSEALMVIETDQEVPRSALDEAKKIPYVISVSVVMP